MGKKMDDRIKRTANELAATLQNYIFMQRLRDSDDENLIQNFEIRGHNTIRSKANAREYLKFMPTNEEVLTLLQTISSFI